MNLLRPLCNRAADGTFSLPADGWYHLVPKGEYPHPETGRVQVLDDAALAAMANRFAEEAKAPHFAGMLIDQEHFSYESDKSSAAQGWVKEVQNRDTGLWGRVEWTDLGQRAITGGVYRFLSPVWLNRDVEHLTRTRVRPLRLDSAGLTNVPNLRGMVPLSNRAEYRETGSAQPHETQPMKSIASALGLSAEASEESILAAVTKLQQELADAKSAAGITANRITKLEADVKTATDASAKLLGDLVEQDLEAHKNRLTPESREAWKATLMANRDTGLALLKGIKAEDTNSGSQSGPNNRAMHNRSATQPPSADAQKQAKEDARAKRIANRAAEISKAQKLPYSQAFRLAKGEIPAES